MRTFIVLLLLVASSALAQPDDQFAAEIAAFKEGMRLSCYAVGPKLGYTPEFVDEFCKCRLKAADESMSAEQWKELGAVIARGEKDKVNRIAIAVGQNANKVCTNEKTS